MTVIMNPDKKLVNQIKDKLKANDGYCPCKLLKNEDTKCMCKDFRDMMERKESGKCDCGLFVIYNDDNIVF